jgi:hypothetical protein
MAEKVPISVLIDELKGIGLYDAYTQQKLDVLASSSFEGSAQISQKERMRIRDLLSDVTQRIEQDGKISFIGLAGGEKQEKGEAIACNVERFLGFGNTGPVYEVTASGQTYALKIYSARQLKEVMKDHGRFGLGGIIQDIEEMDRSAMLGQLGKKVLARKGKQVYGRCNRIVRIHNVGLQHDCMFVLMDMLAVDPMNKANAVQLGGDIVDMACWGVDCAVGLCTLHVEERRLHLNIRPEAFIRKVAEKNKRLPKYTFFNYPATYPRPEGRPFLENEFITVDHLDNSIETVDKGPKGIGTIGSWVFTPPENILQLVKTLRQDYEQHVINRAPFEDPQPIRIARTQMDDIWALGVTLFQFYSGGKYPFGEPKNLAEMVKTILLTPFDFSAIPGPFQDLLSSMLDKDPKKRFARVLDGCPEKVASRKVMAEAVLYKLEEIALRV